ncbi:TonB-dependent receptor [Sphingomonas paucimobilis]|uniref:TonB-dependent receptor n=1 Tax=Sphingomonas paucimobilis TaxID=13689 RepID=UPI0028D0ADF3|nr:TonB-dependent receptor [Sphingomonas paucimobilis]
MSRRLASAVLVGASFIALTAAPAWAQTAPDAPAAASPGVAAAADASDTNVAAQDQPQAQTDGDIVVTAQRRSERLQDVPLAVTAVTSEALAQRQINDTNSLVLAVPSLSYQQGANPTNTSFRIRGVGTALFGQGVESSVSVVTDGVVAIRSAQGFSELADVEQVEVLRGPQGTLFGKNASAGVINVTTSAPSHTFQARGDATIAEHGEYRVRGTMSGPLSDTLSARITGFYSDVRGITRNIGTNRWVNGSEGWGVRGKLSWDATDRLNFVAAGEYRKTNADCCASTFIAITNPTLQKLVGPISASRENRTINEDTDTYSNSKSQTYSLTGNLDLGNATLTSITAYQKFDLDVNQPIDRINAPTPIFVGANAAYAWWNQNHGIVDLKGFTQEVRLANRGNSAINYVVGLFYLNSSINRPFDRRRARCLAGTLGQPCAANNIVYQSSASNITLDQQNIAAFGQTDFKIVGGLRAIAGVRVQYEKGHNYGTRIAPIQAGDTVFPNNPANSGSVRADDTAVTGKAGLQYEFSRNLQTYATYTRGYKGLGYEMEIGGNLAAQNVVQPEHVNAYEIGAKGRTTDGTFSYALALFRSDYTNLQVQANRSDPATGVVQFVTTNAGSSRSQGFELEGTLRPSRDFTVNLGVTYARSRINIDGLNCPLQQQASAPVIATGTPINTCYRTAAGATPQQNLRDRPLQASPDWRISIAPRWDFEIGNALGAFVQTSLAYTSKQNFTSELDPLAVQPAYVIVDANVGFRTSDERYSLTFFVRNLFDENYLTSIAHTSLLSTTAQPFDLVGTYNKDSRRYAGATLGVRF